MLAQHERLAPIGRAEINGRLQRTATRDGRRLRPGRGSPSTTWLPG
jgi:hypothetical protein